MIKKYKNIIFIAFALLVVVTSIGSILAAPSKTTVVLFHTNWQASCRKAINFVPQAVNSYGGRVEYVELNIDAPDTPAKARMYKLPIPRTVPYIYILNSDKEIINQRPYQGESVQQLKQFLDPFIQ